MEIILKQDVDNLGHKNDIVSVRPGYANNFLIPQGLATLATPSAKKVLAENIKQSAHKEAKLREDATAEANKLNAISLTLTAKTSEGNKIFGSVTSAQLAEALEAQGINVDKKNITVGTVKELGSYEASVKIYKDIKATIKFTVNAEGEKAE
ncbi:MAG TPA: 50S ribosomal protein L9 [Candidatus Avirikenella pullistercoris]|nr:50S ribosomal protein L9 [Candidatus Avirikenella pullistercoris]